MKLKFIICDDGGRSVGIPGTHSEITIDELNAILHLKPGQSLLFPSSPGVEITITRIDDGKGLEEQQ